MSDDDPKVVLGEIRDRRAAMSYPDRTTLLLARDDVPRLLAAVEAALSGHEPQQMYARAVDHRGKPVCGHDPTTDEWEQGHAESEDGDWLCLVKPEGRVCRSHFDDEGSPAAWPCEEYTAIAAALTGEAVDG